MAGYWWGEMKHAANILCIMAALLFAESADASNRTSIDIGAGQLGSAIVQLGQQTGSSIGTSDHSVTRISVRGLRGRMSVDEAIRRLLKGKPASAIQINERSWRIVAATPTSERQSVQGRRSAYCVRKHKRQRQKRPSKSS